MTTNPNAACRVTASSSFWRRERAIAVGILQALVFIAAGAASALDGHAGAAPAGGIAGLVAIGFSYLIRQGVFSRATVDEIGRYAGTAASVGDALQSHAEDVVTIVNSLSSDVRALGAGQIAPIAGDVSRVRTLVEDMHQAALDSHVVPAASSISPGFVNSALTEFGGRLSDLERSAFAQAAPASDAAPEPAPADPDTAPAYPTPAPAAPAI